MKKTSKLMAGISSAALALGMAGCSNQNETDWESSNGSSIPPMPENTNCSQWDWDDDDGVWECDDRSSSYFGWYFFAGQFFGTKSALYKHKPYMDYKNSPNFRGIGGTSAPKGSSGFGRGSTSTGG